MCCPPTAEPGSAQTYSSGSRAHLRELGVDDLILGALAGNADAIRLYERRGYRPDVALPVQVGGAGPQEPVAAVKKRRDKEVDEVGDVGAVPGLRRPDR